MDTDREYNAVPGAHPRSAEFESFPLTVCLLTGSVDLPQLGLRSTVLKENAATGSLRKVTASDCLGGIRWNPPLLAPAARPGAAAPRRPGRAYRMGSSGAAGAERISRPESVTNTSSSTMMKAPST